MKKMPSLFRGILLAALLSLAQPSMARAGETTLWEIGQFNQSSEEFGLSFPASDSLPSDPVYHVGQSDWKKDWPAFHPGSANGMAGGREHPFVVIFALNQPPKGVYDLIVSTLHYSPRRPNLRLEINGKRGLFYFHPRISYDRGDFPVAFIPHYSQQQIEIDLPASFFKQGENRLALTCVDDPPEADPANGTSGTGISGIYYDALRLTQNEPKKFMPGEIRASAAPTVFYKQSGGQLKEVVEAIVRVNQKISRGQVLLELNGSRYKRLLSATADFGEQRLEFEVPEWSGSTKGRLRVEAGSIREFEITLEPERKWTVFVAPHTHLDVGYTDYQGKVAELQSRAITQAADLIGNNPDFRFSMDGSWILEQLLSNRSKAKQEEVLNLTRQGKLAVPAQYLNLLTGYASLETLFRSLYCSRTLSREYHLPFEFANITDVPSYSASYPSVLASSGIKYFIGAGNNWRAPFLLYGLWNEKSPFWWSGPDGQKVLFWYSRHYMQVQSLFGLPPRQAAIRDSLPVFLQAYAKAQYKPDVVLIHGTQVENTDLVPETATFVNLWNQEYAYPRLQYATFGDFFKYLDQHFGSQLETYRGDGGPYWEDGIGGDASFVAEDRRNQNRALSAEILSTLTQWLDPSVTAPKALIDDIWRNILLFAEHTWTSWISMSMPDHEQTIRQLEVKDHRATLAHHQIDELLQRSMSQLIDQIHTPSSTLVVFNSLNWRRNALVETDLLKDGAVIRDMSTGQETPYEVLWRKQGFAHIRFLAENLPSVGYKCYAINFTSATPISSANKETTPGLVVENDFYRVVFDAASGAVSRIYDKDLRQELVDEHSPYKLNQYLYVTGGDGNTQIIRPIKSWPVAQLTVHPASGGEIVGAVKTPFGHSIRLRSRALNTPDIRTEVLLFDKEKKIEFLNQVEKSPVLAKEGVYFAFPLAVENPEFGYATQSGWVDTQRDLLLGASLEWFNVQYWMAIHNSKLTVGIVPLDAPLACFGDINRGFWPSEFRPKSSTLFSYVMNNYWDTNYRASQGGQSVFRYVLTSNRSFKPWELSRLGWEHLRPVEANLIMSQEKMSNPERPLSPGGASFLESDPTNIVLINWKRAENGKGMILRLHETAGNETTATLHFPLSRLRQVDLCTGVEDDLKELLVTHNGTSINLDFKPHEVVTVRVQ